MIRINPSDRGLCRELRVGKFYLDRLRDDRMVRQGVVGEKNGCGQRTPNDPRIDGRMRAVDRQHFGTECVQQFEGAIDGLSYAVNVEQTETAVKRHRRKIVLFEDVGKSPIAVALHESVCLQDGL